MSEDTNPMNTRGGHGGYETVELDPIADSATNDSATNDSAIVDSAIVDSATNDSAIVDSAIVGSAFVDAEDALSTDPFADDLSAELAARAPRHYVTRTTTVLAGLVLAVAGFLAGAQVQKHFGTPAAGSTQGRAGLAGAGPGLAAGGNLGGSIGGGSGGQRQGAVAQPSAAAANVTTGTVKMVDGATVYVQTANGDVLTVRTSGSTAVRVTRSGALTDLTPGTQVSVEGAASGDGVVTATKVIKAG